MKIQVIIGSTRQNRFSEKPARWIYEYAKTKPDLEVELVDLRDYPLPFFDEPISPGRLQRKYSDERVQIWSKRWMKPTAILSFRQNTTTLIRPC